MKLLSMQLCNFRQFYGQTPVIKFANGKRNTTIIHGNNGSGKTTLLNAFTWVLYAKFTAAFAHPELLVNKRAITESNLGTSVECYVEILFEHDYKKYQTRRKCYAFRDRYDKIQSTEAQLFMLVAGDDGKWTHPPEHPEDIIEKILPQSLHQYFFFDGEHIDHIFRSDDRLKIAEDTKELIGVKVLDRAINHLKNAQKNLNNELKDIGDIETKKLLKQQNQLETSLAKLQEQNDLLNQKLVEQEERKKSINSQLLAISGAENLQKLKQQLETEERELRKNLSSAHTEIKKLISSQGYLVFLGEVRDKFQNIIENLREKGELPSGIKQQFVQQLLTRKQCICGTELVEGSEFYQQVKAWMNKAGIAAVEEAAIRLETQVNQIELQNKQFWQEVDGHQDNINQWRSQLASVENKLDDLVNKLRQYPDGEIQKLQQNLDKIDQNIRQFTLNQGEMNLQIENVNKEIEVLKKQLQKNQIKAEKQALAQKRINCTQEAIERIIEVKTRLEHQFRLSLEKRVQEIFSSISFTPYIPRLSNNYQLNLIENTSGVAVTVAASTGENQILSLSFIGGIIDMVRQWSQKDTLMGPDSSTFPIVMDSPFGSLDEIYRRQVAKSIPQLANQLVVLVTKTQWRGEVETEMKNYINKEYILVYVSPKPDCEEDYIQLNGTSYPLVKKSDNEFEYTEIMEVNCYGKESY
jgi:DNA sulfur modification protein DndD